MYLIIYYPVLASILFLIAPIIGGFISVGLFLAGDMGSEGKIKKNSIIERAFKGIGFGFLIDLPLLCVVLWLFSAM